MDNIYAAPNDMGGENKRMEQYGTWSVSLNLTLDGKTISWSDLDEISKGCIDRIEIVPQKRTGKDAFRAMKLTERSLRTFAMYSGEEKTVKMRFSNHMANVMIDRFGREIVMAYEDERHFTVSTTVEVSPQFYGWVCGLGKAVRLLAPADVVEGFGAYVKGIAEMY